MGGHGGLNILPQKRWNVYNWENRERVRRDEEEAARQQQEQAQEERERESKTRLAKLRTSRGHHHQPVEELHSVDNGNVDSAPLASHDQLLVLFKEDKQGESNKRRRLEPKKTVKKEGVAGEDEKYKLGYGIVPNSRPWYMNVSNNKEDEEEIGNNKITANKKKKKVSVEELRAERVKREEDERGKARSLLTGMSSTRKKHYNSSYGNARS